MNYISNIEMFTVFIVRSKGIIQDYVRRLGKDNFLFKKHLFKFP